MVIFHGYISLPEDKLNHLWAMMGDSPQKSLESPQRDQSPEANHIFVNIGGVIQARNSFWVFLDWNCMITSGFPKTAVGNSTDWHGELLQVGHGCLSRTDLAGEIPRESLAVPQRKKWQAVLHFGRVKRVFRLVGYFLGSSRWLDRESWNPQTPQISRYPLVI